MDKTQAATAICATLMFFITLFNPNTSSAEGCMCLLLLLIYLKPRY